MPDHRRYTPQTKARKAALDILYQAELRGASLSETTSEQQSLAGLEFRPLTKAILQGIVAILLVGAAYLFLRGTTVSMTDATRALEIGSYALIALFGAWLLYKKLRPAPVRPASTLGISAVEVHGHQHHAGEVCATCGHAHAPDPSLLKGDRFALREAWSAIVAVGLRPCSGALIVLSFALLNGLYLGGMLVMAWNVWLTAISGRSVKVPIPAVHAAHA